jgi:hypothetical protein
VVLILFSAFAYVAMTPWQVLSATLWLSIAYAWQRTTAWNIAQAPVWLKMATIVSVAAVGAPTVASAVYAWQELAPVLPPVLCIQTIPLTIGPFLTWLSALAIFVVMGRVLTTQGRFLGAAAAGSLVVQMACFSIPDSPLYGWMGVQRTEDIDFVKTFLKQRRAGDSGLPTVYWTAANLEDIWFSLPAKSFYVTQQVAGNMFHRGTAIEGDRRARLVGAFDVEAWRTSRYGIADWKRRSLERVYGRDFDSAAPSLEDLQRLCGEDAVDVAVLPVGFDGWFACSNGRWFVYDCRLIRELLAARLSRSREMFASSADSTSSTGSAGCGNHAKSQDAPSTSSP